MNQRFSSEGSPVIAGSSPIVRFYPIAQEELLRLGRVARVQCSVDPG